MLETWLYLAVIIKGFEAQSVAIGMSFVWCGLGQLATFCRDIALAGGQHVCEITFSSGLRSWCTQSRSSRGQVSLVEQAEGSKLLYFADKSHLLGHGAPILGDVYWCMDYGPVPSFALNEMSAPLRHQKFRCWKTSTRICSRRCCASRKKCFWQALTFRSEAEL